jgi:hypothetical protein
VSVWLLQWSVRQSSNVHLPRYNSASCRATMYSVVSSMLLKVHITINDYLMYVLQWILADGHRIRLYVSSTKWVIGCTFYSFIWYFLARVSEISQTLHKLCWASGARQTDFNVKCHLEVDGQRSDRFFIASHIDYLYRPSRMYKLSMIQSRLI